MAKKNSATKLKIAAAPADATPAKNVGASANVDLREPRRLA
jgi:hypothetical protein